MFLALAELRRARGRFALLGAAVGLLVLLLLFFQAVAGALTGGLTGAYEQAAADVWVYDDQARLNPQGSVLDESVAEQVADVTGVATASLVTFTVFDVDGEPSAVLATDAGSPALPRGVDGVLDAGTAVAATSAFVEGDAADVLALPGVDLDVAATADGATFAILPTYFAPRDAVATATSERAGRDVPLPTSAVAVTVADGEDPVAVAAAISDAVDGIEAVDRATAIEGLPGAGTITRSFGILYVLLYVVVAIVTGVFFLILTVQKRDALVLLRAVGAERGDVVRPVLVQVVVVVGVAVLVGTAAAVGLLSAARDVFGAGLDGSTILTSAGAILLLGLVAGLASLRRVLRAEPVEAVADGGL